MKIIFTLILFFNIFTYRSIAQIELNDKQKKEIINIAIITSKKLSNLILIKFTSINKNKDTILINLLPLTSNNKPTILGYKLAYYMEGILQALLNKNTLRKYYYRIDFNKEHQPADYKLNIDYTFNDDSIYFTKILLTSHSEKISLTPFVIHKDLSILKELNIITQNIFFEKIFNLNPTSDSILQNFIIISSSDTIKTNTDSFRLKLNIPYKFRFYIQQPHIFLYVFYYEPDRSLFYIIYPYSIGENKPTTYYIKEVKNMIFNDVKLANLITVISTRKLILPQTIFKNNNIVTSEDAHKIYKQLLEYKTQISIRKYYLIFYHK